MSSLPVWGVDTLDSSSISHHIHKNRHYRLEADMDELVLRWRGRSSLVAMVFDPG